MVGQDRVDLVPAPGRKRPGDDRPGQPARVSVVDVEAEDALAPVHFPGVDQGQVAAVPLVLPEGVDPGALDRSRTIGHPVVEEETRTKAKTDGPPLVGRRQRMKPTRERGRPARTILGTAWFISSTRLDRQRRQDSALSEPMPYRPAGWPGAASQGTERHRTGVHAGGTPALPGGASYEPRRLAPHRLDCGGGTGLGSAIRSGKWLRPFPA